MTLSVRMYIMISSRRHIPMRSLDLWDRELVFAKALPKQSRSFWMLWESGVCIAICGNNPEKGIKYRHTWNIVRIGGTYYHLDATFDNTLGNSDKAADIRYDYFNLDDGHVFKDHEPLIAAAPHCTDHDHFYYKEKKLSFTKTEDVYKRSLQAAKKGKTLTFHWRGGYLIREVLDELLGLIRKAGEEKNKTAVVNINWPQAVLRLYYTEAQMQECITMEDANEGEKE